MKCDYSLYLVTDRGILKGRSLLQAVEEALAGGVTLVQLREKDICSRDFYQLGLAMKELTARFGVPLLINDRLDIALAVDADGVHIGQEDLPLAVVRRLIGPDKIVGYSVSNPTEARYGEKNGADYLGAGPVYVTSTKKVDIEPLGPAGLRQITAAVSIPVVGIGGINLNNIQKIKNSGLAGVSIVSGILGSDDPGRTARLIRQQWGNV
ncbi:MAG: thiamine phosphate synthase [Clostridia bacterium]|nr:thiamine phosphate synthase [Clostridia bacterium]